MRKRHLMALGAGAAITAGTLLSMGITAGAASATVTPGPTGPGSWNFYQDNGDQIQLGQTHTSSNTVNVVTTQAGPTLYQAQVQQPINAPGQIPSVFSNKTRTIPVKYTVQAAPSTQTVTTPTTTTTTTTGDTVYPGLLDSEHGGTPSFTNLLWNAPSGITVGAITNLMANFQWQQGTNSAGSMRWTINTNRGNVDVYYGEPFNTNTSNTTDSGMNMITDANSPAPNAARVDAWPTNNNTYDTWNNTVMSNPAVANEPVNWVGLIVDSGYNGAEQVQLSSNNPAVIIDTTATNGHSTYTPGTIPGGTQTSTTTGTPVVSSPVASGPYAATTIDPMWVSLTKISGSAPPAPVDETMIDNTQGDSGGQFRVADGFYMYNLPMSQLDPTAQYQLGISPNSNGSSPVGVVQFGLK